MSEKKRSSLQLRVISACILAPIAIGALFLGGLYFTVFLGLAGIAMGYEWCRASVSSHSVIFTLLTVASLLAALGFAHFGLLREGFVVLLCGAAVMAVIASLIGQKQELAWIFIGPLWTGVPVISLVALRALPDIGFALTTSLFLVIWATDIGAYFSGRTIGGPKIAPVISPNKTWAGLIGGIVAAMIVAYVATAVLMTADIAPIVIMILGGACAILAQVGDFTESAWKRKFNIKDASNLIPGHGGVLDRLDSVLFVAPVFLALTLFYFGN